MACAPLVASASPIANREFKIFLVVITVLLSPFLYFSF
jgi:nitrate reductase NapE component